MSKKVGVLTSAHPPFDQRIFYKECVSLAECGYDVTLIVPHEHDEIVHGVRVQAIPRETGRLRRFTLTGFRLYREAARLRADVYHVHDPELLFVAMLLKITNKCKIVFDAHEDYTQLVMRRAWIPLPLRKFVRLAARAVMHTTLPFFDGVVAATESIAAGINNRNKVVVKNYSLLSVCNHARTREANLLVYAGAISQERGLNQFLQAFQSIREALPVRLRLIGKPEDPKVVGSIQRDFPPGSVEFIGWTPHPQAIDLIAGGTLGILMDLPLPGSDGPHTKLFEYMALGLPVVGPDLPTARGIIEETGCGIVVDFRKHREVAEIILTLLQDPTRLESMSRSGMEAFPRFTWSSQASRLIDFYRSLGGQAQEHAEPCVQRIDQRGA
jgi:glycosyltransferase involved in cell wall biosynthesis